MNLAESKIAFIDQWGAMAGNWGVPRSMAQIYALLLIEPEPMNVEEIMETLKISRGNISMSMKDLMAWGLVYKVFKTGDRKDYFEAEKDMWVALGRIVAERKQRELDPAIRQIDRLKELHDDNADPKELQAFNTALSGIHEMAVTTENFLDILTSSKKVKLFKWFNKLQKKSK